MSGSEQANSVDHTHSTGRVLLELCTGSLGDVEIASTCHVDRIELNSGMAVGGLTPTLALAKRARETFAGPIIAMIRPREGGFCYSRSDFLLMLNDAEVLLPLGIEGLATGLLTAMARLMLIAADASVRCFRTLSLRFIEPLMWCRIRSQH